MACHNSPLGSAVHFGRLVLIALALSPSLVGVACKGRGEAVGRLESESDTVRLAYPECAALPLKWTPAVPLPGLRGRPRVFVHLLRPGKTLVRTFDHDLPQSWLPGQPQRDVTELCESALTDPLAAGTYDLAVGLYDSAGGARFPLTTSGEQIGPREYRVATVEVAMRRGNAPRFEFSPEWGPLAEGADKQVLARRWLFGAGVMRLAGLAEAGAVRLELRVPDSGPTKVRVSSTCAAHWDVTLEVGLSVVHAPVGDALPGSTCELLFTPDLPAGTPAAPRSVGIEGLAWIPASHST